MHIGLRVLLIVINVVYTDTHTARRFWDEQETKYGYFDDVERLELLEVTRQMFYFGYDNYMKHAFPMDELDPIHCTGRGPDYDNPSNININDVLGDYSLTLLDALDTLAIMGNGSEFQRAVRLIVDNVSFDKPSTVQVFEATIRVLGSLISGHLIISDKLEPFGPMGFHNYNDELLHLAHDLASRLIAAFENTATGIPHPRVNLQTGVPIDGVNETCLAGAGTLLLEFGLLSRLLNDPVYEGVARRAVNRLWSFRSNVTGLFGNVINIQTGKWTGFMSGLGAGLDSFYEYLLKSFIMFGDEDDLTKFNESYRAIQYYMRRGRKQCNSGIGVPPLYVNVNMWNGEPMNNWMDSLQAAWPAVQVLAGDLEEAICLHSVYYAIWRRFNALPERYNWQLHQPEVLFYPLRPEFVESTYYLYQATKNPFYLHVGKDILNSLNNYTKVECGYATMHDVTKKDHEDRMESFFLGETCKYLYLLFDVDNHVNREAIRYIFSTEGHLFPVNAFNRQPVASEFADSNKSSKVKNTRRQTDRSFDDPADSNDAVFNSIRSSNVTSNCDRVPAERRYHLPLQFQYLQQVQHFIGLF